LQAMNDAGTEMSGGPVGGPPPAPEAMVRERDDGGLPDGPMDSNEASTQSKWQVLRQLYPRVTAAQMAMTLERAEGDTARVHEILDMMNKRAIKKEQERLAEALASPTPSRPASRQASRQPSRSPAAGQQGGTSSRALVEHTPPLIEGVPVPEGWTVHTEESSRRRYYHDVARNYSTWRRPWRPARTVPTDSSNMTPVVVVGDRLEPPNQQQTTPAPPARPPTRSDEAYILMDEVCMTIGICICWGAAIAY